MSAAAAPLRRVEGSFIRVQPWHLDVFRDKLTGATEMLILMRLLSEACRRARDGSMNGWTGVLAIDWFVGATRAGTRKRRRRGEKAEDAGQRTCQLAISRLVREGFLEEITGVEAVKEEIVTEAERKKCPAGYCYRPAVERWRKLPNYEPPRADPDEPEDEEEEEPPPVKQVAAAAEPEDEEEEEPEAAVAAAAAGPREVISEPLELEARARYRVRLPLAYQRLEFRADSPVRVNRMQGRGETLRIWLAATAQKKGEQTVKAAAIDCGKDGQYHGQVIDNTDQSDFSEAVNDVFQRIFDSVPPVKQVAAAAELIPAGERQAYLKWIAREARNLKHPGGLEALTNRYLRLVGSRKRAARAEQPRAAPPPACQRCRGSGVVGKDWDRLPELKALLASGAEVCDCDMGREVAELVD